MILLDAFGLIALLKAEPAAGEVEALLRGGVGMLSINLAEAVDVLGRVDGIDGQEVRGLVEPLLSGPITVQSVTVRHAWRSAELRRRYYSRRRCPLSLADCLLLAAASASGLATADPDVLGVARAEGISTTALPPT